MKSKKMISVLASIVLLSAMVIIGIWIQKYSSSEAASVDGAGKITIPTKDNAYAVGTEQNPFVILEIVPYEGYAEIGYLIDGQEPVNIDALSWANEYYENIASTNAFDIIKSGYIETFFPSNGMKNSITCMVMNATQNGYYEKVASNTGNYIQSNVIMENGQIKSADYTEVTQNTGNYIWHGLEYGITHGKVTDHNAALVYTSKTSTLYRCTGVIAKNRNLFLTECLNLSTEQIANYRIKVMTVTSKQLNKNLDLIDRANLIYITDKSHNEVFTKYWADMRLRRTDMFSYVEVLPKELQPRFYTSGYDLSWDAVVKILQKKIGYDLPAGVSQSPVIYDVCSLTDIGEKKSVIMSKKTKDNKTVKYPDNGSKADASENNVYKLGLMMRQMNSEDLYNLYFKTNMIRKVTKASDSSMSTGEFLNKDGTSVGTYWNVFTLIPYHLINLGTNTGITNEMNNQLNALGYLTNTGFSDTYNTIAGNELFVFNGNNSLEMNFTQQSVAYNSATTKEAFDYYDMTSGTRSPAQVIRFLLATNNTGEDIENLTILEVQPFDDFKTETQWKIFIKKMLPGFHGELTIKAMSSKEFICHIEELVGTYDLVYIGLNDAFATPIEKYDLALDGLVYSHVGKEITVNLSSDQMYKWIPNVAGNNFVTRFAGNDITKLKLNQLLEYVKIGYPIMFGSGMFNGANITNKLDTSSYLYSLVNTIKSDNAYKEKMIYEDTVTRSQFVNLIAKVNCNVDFDVLPKEYKDPITLAEEGKPLPPQGIYINQSNNSYRYLNYEFTISDDGSGSYYSASLFIDANADGVYLKTSGLDNEELVIGDVIDVDNNTTVESDRLLAGRHYRIQKNITEYSGVITWKISIERLKQNVNGSFSLTGIKDNQTGISAIKKSTSKAREQIKVLQIQSNASAPGNSSVPSIYLPTKAEIDASGAASKTGADNVANSFLGKIKNENGATIDPKLAKASGLFYYYINNLTDYEIIFERMSVSQYISQASTINLDKYQMLIIGFADVCTDIGNTTARSKIEQFIAKGKTVLFTHDTTFYPSTHNTTKTFRERLGLDRFGALLMLATPSISVQDLINKGKDIMYAPNTAKATGSVLLKQSYGFTNQQVRRYTNTSYNISFDNLVTQEVSNINDGQITKYPYEISDELTDEVDIAPTHYQYFQLDLEDEDVVVWYSLKKDGVYDKNDGRNAYYIYNKGNITYSGAGHYSTGFTTWEMPKQEVKLFVNTIIAAYRATPIPTEVEILNTDKSTDRMNKDYLLIDYDSENAEYAIGNEVNLTDQTKRIYFRLNDKTTITYSDLKIFYYTAEYPSDTAVLTPLTSVVTRRKLNNATVAYNDVAPSTDYYIDVPLDILNNKNSKDIAIKLVLSYISDTGATVELEPYVKYVQLLRRGLFNLD